MATERKQLLSAFGWNLLEKSSVKFISFIVTIVLSRNLLPEEFGIVALIMIFIVLADVIVDGGLNTALIQKKNSDNIDFSTIFFVSIGIACMMYGILAISAQKIAYFYSQPELTHIIQVLSLSLFFYAGNAVQRAYAIKNMLFRKMFYCNFGATFSSGIIGIYLAYYKFGTWALVAQTLTNIIFSCIFMWFVIRWRPAWTFSFPRLKSLYNYGWKIFLTNFIIALFVRIRALLIGKMFSPSTLAYYDKGNQFPGLISDNVCGSIQTVLFPAFSEVQQDRERVKAMMRRSINVSCLFMFPLMMGLAACAKPIVILLLTEKWLPCVPYIQILCLANFFRPITIPNNQAIMAMGYSNITLKLEIIRKIVDITILVISCMYGALGIAWGVVIFNFLCLFINLVPNIKLLNYKITEQIWDVTPTFICSIIMGSIIYLISYTSFNCFVQLSLQFFLGILIFGGLCYIFKVESFKYTIILIKNRNLKK